MPGLPYQQMPAQQITPESILSSGLRQQQTALQQDYDTNLKYFQDTARSDEEFWGNVRELQRRSDLRANEIQQKYQQQIGTIQNIQKMTQQGLLSPETGKRATDKMAGIPTSKQTDWRTEHGRTFAELRRINAILTSKNSRGKPNFPRTWRGKDYAWDKMSPQKQQDLQQMLNAQKILQEQQQELFGQLPRAQQKAFGIQNATMRKSGPWLTTDSSGRRHFNVRAILNTPEQQGTFGEKIAVDMPRPKMIAPKQNLSDPLGIR